MGVKRVAVATPYEDWVNELKKKFFEGSGVQVLNIRGLGLWGWMSVKYTRDTLPICQGSRQEIGKLFLSSNQTTLWKLFRLCRIPGADIRCDFESLFQKY